MVNREVHVLTGWEGKVHPGDHRANQETKHGITSVSKQIVKLYLVFPDRQQRRSMASAGIISVILGPGDSRGCCFLLLSLCLSPSWGGDSASVNLRNPFRALSVMSLCAQPLWKWLRSMLPEKHKNQTSSRLILYLLFGRILNVFDSFNCGTVLRTCGGGITINADEGKMLRHWAGMIHWSHNATL